MQYEVRTMPDGVYVVVTDGKTVTQHNSYADAQRVSDHMNKLAEYKKEQQRIDEKRGLYPEHQDITN